MYYFYDAKYQFAKTMSSRGKYRMFFINFFISFILLIILANCLDFHIRVLLDKIV